METRRRKGHISETRGRRGTYYRAVLCVNYRHLSKCSYDRAECEAWLAEVLAAHPTWERAPRPSLEAARRAKAAGRARVTTGRRPAPRRNPFAAAAGEVRETPPLWMVVAETNPLTASYHIFLRRDWERPGKVLTYDNISESPVAWVADDNGGAGYGSREEARMAALATAHDPSVMLTVRPLSRWCGTDDN